MSLDRFMYRDATGPSIVIPHLHHKSHDGELFHVSGKITGLTDTSSTHILISTGATMMHLNRTEMAFSRGDVDVLMYEGVTTSADGTGLSEIDVNRNTANTPLTSFFTGPTITGQGTLIHTAWAPPTATGTGKSAEGISGSSTGEEWLFVPSTKYDLVVTNQSGATISVWYEFLFYEQDI